MAVLYTVKWQRYVNSAALTTCVFARIHVARSLCGVFNFYTPSGHLLAIWRKQSQMPRHAAITVNPACGPYAIFLH